MSAQERLKAWGPWILATFFAQVEAAQRLDKRQARLLFIFVQGQARGALEVLFRNAHKLPRGFRPDLARLEDGQHEERLGAALAAVLDGTACPACGRCP